MAELVAVQSGLALFSAGEVGVIIDTQDLNPYDPQPLQTILAAGTWDKNVDTIDVPRACQELADVALEDFAGDVALTASANDARLVRVPKTVQDAVRTGMETLKNDDSLTVSLVAAGVADKLLGGSVTVETVKRIHTHFQSGDSVATRIAYGGDAGRKWVAKVCGDEPLTAAAPPTAPAAAPAEDDTEWVDPEKPHEFVALDEGDATCALCGQPADAPIHTGAGASSQAQVQYFATFAPGGDQGTTFKVDAILAKDEEDTWWMRELGEWVPTQSPAADDDVLQLDYESFVSAAKQLDEPGTSYAELSITEARLHELALAELDLGVIDAVFAAAPYVPPEVRSANAKKQLRDAKGHFIVQGGQVQDVNGDRGTIARVDKAAGTVDVKTPDGSTKTIPANEVTVDHNASASQTPAPAAAAVKARLPKEAPLVEDVHGLIQQYQAKWSEELGNGSGDAASQAPSGPVDDNVTPKAVQAAGDPLIPPDDPAPASNVPSAGGPSKPEDVAPDAGAGGDDPVANAGVTPLYLAEVDPQDVGAVLDCLAVIPSKGAGDAIDVYKRDAGKWVADPEALAAIQGPTPPPLVELDADMLANVLGQMDVKPEAPAAPPVAAAGYAVLRQFSLSAGGELTFTQTRGARLLLPYGDVLPADVIGALDELAEGGADRNRGNAERLREYWVHGEGAAKIEWGTPGDYNRCVAELGKYMGERAHGYCQLRHKDATGFYAGHAPTEQVPHAKVAALVGEVQDDAPDAMPVDPDVPHDFIPYTGDSDFIDPDECETCGRPPEHPLHIAVVEVPDEDIDAPADSEEADVVADQPHAFEAGPDGHCECGKPVDDPIHTMTADPEYAPDEEFSSEDLASGLVDYSKPHKFVPSPDAADGPDVCDCGRPKNDPLHVVTAHGGPHELADSAADVQPGQRFRIPLVVPEGVTSGDGRTFAENSLSSRDMPLALMWQPEGDEGHKGAVIVGRIDHVERTPEGLGNAYGVFDTGEHGQEALRLVRGGMLRGISADLDEFEADVIGGGEDENKVTSTKLMVQSGRLMGITLVAKPAYAECTIELVDEGDNAVADGEYSEETAEARVAALIASAAPLVPPKSWFQNPNLSKPTHLTVDDDGRVFGHIAAWDVDHIGLPFGTRAPRSASGYAYFRTGVIRTQEGEDVPVGQLTLSGGHAPLQADARAAVKHYDDTASAVADLAAGEDQYGIWVSGALRPHVTPEQVRALRASSPSGDWRPIRNKLELVAVCQVNVPGFPVARAMVSSGVVTALVAAGALALEPDTEDVLTELTIDRRLAALEAAESKRLAAEALAIRERMSPVLQERRAALTAAAQAAKERIDLVRNEKRATLEARREELRARVAAGGLHVVPPFEEGKHPRDRQGKFRDVLARLEHMVGHHDDARPGVQRVEDAAGKEEAGDHAGAAAAGRDGADQLEAAAAKATGEVKAQLHQAASDVRDAADALDGDKPKGEEHEVFFDDLADELKSLAEEALTRAEEKLNPANPREAFDKFKAFVTGTRPWNMRDVANFVKNQLKREFKPSPPTVGPQAPSAQPPVPAPAP